MVLDPGLLLTIDQGNSTTDCCLFAGEHARRRARVAGSPEAILAWLAGEPVACVVALSVRSERLDVVRAVAARLAVPLLLAGVDLPCPLRNAYHRPAELGVDRWVGAVAAWRRFGAALTIDCGTAVTLNLVSADGVFCGGAITSGFGTMARGLAAAAPALAVDLETAPAESPARSTAAALRLGLRLGFVGMVERLAEELLAGAVAPTTVVVTGGEAPVFLAHTRRSCVVVPDLNHQGLRLLASAR